jgi:hypothetical protein
VYLQINTVKYDADQEVTNICENLQKYNPSFSPRCYYLFIFGLLQISIGLSVFGFVANEYKQIAIRLLSTICNIRSAIQWAIMKVILNYSPLPRINSCVELMSQSYKTFFGVNFWRKKIRWKMFYCIVSFFNNE